MFLCIDTATDEAGVALGNDYLPLDPKNASESIFEIIDQLVKKADIQLSDLKGVFVIKGPGSFTGLRVGVAVANQFAHQLDIPIAGLQTEEWYRYRIDEKDFIYLQSMNRDQVYMVGFGKFERDFPQEVVSISDCHYELVNADSVKWLGQLSDDHAEKLKEMESVADLLSPVDAWVALAGDYKLGDSKKYQLVEPFYGKEPTITKSKKKLGI